MIGAVGSIGRLGLSTSLRLWTPARIGTALWLDAADASTVILSGSTVSQWGDKSGSGNHATQATASVQPVYVTSGAPGLDFDNTDDFLGISSPVGLGSQGDFFYAAVFAMRSDARTWRMVRGGGLVFNAGGTGILLLQRMISAAQIGCHNTGAADTRIKVDVSNSFVPTVATIGRTGGVSGNGGNVTVTATNPVSSYITTAAQSWTSSAASVFQIGGRQQGSDPAIGWLNGVIYECIALSRNASTIERQQVEGYLAWKWQGLGLDGLVSGLPAGHPYKTAPPS